MTSSDTCMRSCCACWTCMNSNSLGIFHILRWFVGYFDLWLENEIPSQAWHPKSSSPEVRNIVVNVSASFIGGGSVHICVAHHWKESAGIPDQKLFFLHTSSIIKQWSEFEWLRHLQVQDSRSLYLVSRPKDDPEEKVRQLHKELASQGEDKVIVQVMLAYFPIWLSLQRLRLLNSTRTMTLDFWRQ